MATSSRPTCWCGAPPDGKLALRVIDFGIGGLSAARAVQELRAPTCSRPALLTEAVRGAHTPVYASPEQMARRPGEKADPRDDVHALGVIWYQLITGDMGMMSIPSDWREQLGEHGVGEELIRLLGSCFAPKAEKRPAGAAALVEQVNDANVPMLELIDDGAVGPAEAEKRRPAAPKTVRPDNLRGAPQAVQRATARPKPHAGTTQPAETSQRRTVGETRRAAEPARNRWPAPWVLGLLGAGLAAFILVAIVSLALFGAVWSGSTLAKPRALQAKISQENAAKDNGRLVVESPLPKEGGLKPSSDPVPMPQPPQSPKDLAKKAETEKLLADQKAMEALALAEQKEAQALADFAKKEKEAQALKKVMEAIEDAKLKLKAKAPQERKAAIAALARIGDAAASADYDLCQMIAFDPLPELRQDAQDALEKVQRKLHPLVVTLFLPPEGNRSNGYCMAIKALPTFGRAGLPLIALQLQNPSPSIQKLATQRQALLLAHAEALAMIAPKDEVALQLLMTLPESPLATNYTKNLPHLQLMMHREVAKRLSIVGTTKPETRKSMVPYFIGMLQSNDPAARQLGANALAGFGSDAENAVPVLKKMSLDPSENVRNAVRNAIAAIEKRDK